MRLWTINFKYLDAKGLVALWREALLAKNVLAGLTKGYKNHPQLDRFYAHENALEAINAYLAGFMRRPALADINLTQLKRANLTSEI